MALRGLRPLTRYQVWLQAYLRNGKVIESNVLEVATNDRKDGFGGGVGGGGERASHELHGFPATLLKILSPDIIDNPVHGAIHKGRPHERGGRGVPEKQKNVDMGEGGVLPIWTSFLRCLIWCFQVLVD